MRCSVAFLSCAVVCAVALNPTHACAVPLVVAAENTWGNLAEQVVGPDMQVKSLLTQPTLDPHLYEPGPSEGRLVHDAALLIANGAGYDTWVERLAQARSGSQPRSIRAQDVADWHEGDNVHLWYNIKVVRAFVQRLAAECQQLDPAHAAGYASRSAKLLAEIGQVQQRVDVVRAQVHGVPVAATEPVFTPMAESLGLVMKEQAFQLAVMNDVEPPPSAVALFDDDITQHKLRLIAYNAQASRPSVQRLVDHARQVGIPVLPVYEIMPPGLQWQSWFMQTVEQVAQVLGAKL